MTALSVQTADLEEQLKLAQEIPPSRELRCVTVPIMRRFGAGAIDFENDETFPSPQCPEAGKADVEAAEAMLGDRMGDGVEAFPHCLRDQARPVAEDAALTLAARKAEALRLSSRPRRFKHR